MNDLILKTTPKQTYQISCIIPIYNGSRYLCEAINSVINQTLEFTKHIQIILINDGSTDNTEEICLEYVNKYQKNIVYAHSCRSFNNKGVSAARNAGLKYATGEYISFLDADDLLDPDFYATAIKYLSIKNSNDSIDLVVFPLDQFDSAGVISTSSSSYRFTDTRLIDIFQDPDYIQFGICNTVIRKSKLNDLYFNEDLRYSEDAEFAHRLILKHKRYYIIKEPSYKYRKRSIADFSAEEDIKNNFSSMQKRLTQLAWYNKFLVFGKLLIDSSVDMYGDVIEYTQYLLVHELMSGAISRIPEQILNKIDIKNILNSIYESLLVVSDTVILSIRHVNKWYKYFFLNLKYNFTFIQVDDDFPAFYVGNCLFEKLSLSLTIHKIIVIQGELHILCSYDLPQYEGFKYVCESNDKREIKSYVNDYYITDIYYLAKLIHQTKTITFVISLYELNKLSVSFFIMYGINRYPVNLLYTDSVACLNHDAFTYILRKSYKIDKNMNTNELLVSSTNYKSQDKYIFDVINKALDINKNILSTLIKYHNQINLKCKIKYWLFFGCANQKNNNLDIFYTYCKYQKDSYHKICDKNDLNNHFINNVDSDEDVFINEIQYSMKYEYLNYSSDKILFYFLISDALIISSIHDLDYFPLIGCGENVLNVIKQYNLIYLPTIPEKELIDNCILGNMSIWVVSTEDEKTIIKNKYRYYDINESIIKVYRFPYKNSPISQNKRIILIKPDYRPALYKGYYIYNDNFKDSEYCKSIRDLLNNEELLEAIYEYDYKIYFSPHEKTYCQIFDFKLNDSIIIIENNNITEKFISECSICITDNYIKDEYLYLKKPIIFFNFNDDDYKILTDTDLNYYSFGEYANSNNIIDLIIGYIKNECKMPQKFIENVNMYFDIKQNEICKYLYDEIQNL